MFKLRDWCQVKIKILSDSVSNTYSLVKSAAEFAYPYTSQWFSFSQFWGGFSRKLNPNVVPAIAPFVGTMPKTRHAYRIALVTNLTMYLAHAILFETMIKPLLRETWAEGTVNKVGAIHLYMVSWAMLLAINPLNNLAIGKGGSEETPYAEYFPACKDGTIEQTKANLVSNFHYIAKTEAAKFIGTYNPYLGTALYIKAVGDSLIEYPISKTCTKCRNEKIAENNWYAFGLGTSAVLVSKLWSWGTLFSLNYIRNRLFKNPGQPINDTYINDAIFIMVFQYFIILAYLIDKPLPGKQKGTDVFFHARLVMESWIAQGGDIIIKTIKQTNIQEFLGGYDLSLIPKLPAVGQELKTNSIITPDGLFQLNKNNTAYKCVLSAEELRKLKLNAYLNKVKELAIPKKTNVQKTDVGEPRVSIKDILTLEQLNQLNQAVILKNGHSLESPITPFINAFEKNFLIKIGKYIFIPLNFHSLNRFLKSAPTQSFLEIWGDDIQGLYDWLLEIRKIPKIHRTNRVRPYLPYFLLSEEKHEILKVIFEEKLEMVLKAVKDFIITARLKATTDGNLHKVLAVEDFEGPFDAAASKPKTTLGEQQVEQQKELERRCKQELDEMEQDWFEMPIQKPLQIEAPKLQLIEDQNPQQNEKKLPQIAGTQNSFFQNNKNNAKQENGKKEKEDNGKQEKENDLFNEFENMSMSSTKTSTPTPTQMPRSKRRR